jgi:hypothetical protein
MLRKQLYDLNYYCFEVVYGKNKTPGGGFPG